MDDLLTGRHGSKETIFLYKEFTELLVGGGFHIRKWVLNDLVVLQAIPQEDRALSDSIKICLDDTVKVRPPRD